MRFACSNCKKELNIADEKLPPAPRFKVKCPHCASQVVLDKSAALGGPAPEEQQGRTPDPMPGSFGIMEPEIFPPGARIFFHLLSNPDWTEGALNFFQEMGYHESTAKDVDEAVLKMRLNDYNTLLLDDSIEQKKILKEIGDWAGIRRRKLNVILFGNSAASMDPITAFLKGVNLYINYNDTARMQELFASVLKGYDEYYSFYYKAEDAL